MTSIAIVDDLFRHSVWANERILGLCADLTDQQLDEQRELGLGSLRNTLYHICVSEEIWLERWKQIPWRPFPMDASGAALDEISLRLQQVAAERKALLDRERGSRWRGVCHYKDSKGNEHSNPLIELMHHVANHGIHHRAQAIHYLKGFGRTITGGLDYLFFRLAKPNVRQEPDTRDSMRQFGLEVETGTSPAVDWDPQLIQNYFAYGDWANERLMGLVSSLDDAALDRPFGMGMNTIRKTQLHIADAERWWLRNWTIGPTPFEKAPESTSNNTLREQWRSLIANRNQFVTSVNADSAQRVVTVIIGTLSVKVPVIESMTQLGGHGTHHRAQLINMLRRSQITPPGCDYIIWLREVAAKSAAK